MKICYLADGRSIHTFRWLKYFVEKENDVHLITMRPARDSVRKLSLTLHENKMGFKSKFLQALNYLLTLPFVVYRIRKIKPDVLHIHYVLPYGLYAFLSRMPYILSVWGSDVLILPDKGRLSKFLISKVIKKAKLILYDGGEHMLKRLSELGANTSRLNKIYFGTNTKVFSPSKRSKKIKKKLRMTNDFLIVSTRNLEPLYDLKTYIEAAALVLKKRKDVNFILIGEGSQREELEELVRKLGISNNVKFIGKVSEEEMANYLASSDIYVSTSLSDAGISASTAEAMSCGIPVVITDFGDNSKWVIRGVNGFLFNLRDNKALAKYMLKLIENKKLRKSFGEINTKLIKEKNNYHKEMEKVNNLYNSRKGVY
jgi:glycosyltransferase involved in cell wall biosynthesis